MALSLAAYDAVGRRVVGVVYDPFRDELFSAVSGSGAELNGQRLRVCPPASLPEAVVGVEPTGEAALARPCLRSLYVLSAPAARGVRILGSASLSLAWVACGRLGAFYTLGRTRGLDAGALLVAEAGGKITDCTGQALAGGALGQGGGWGTPLCATGGGAVHAELLEVLGRVGATGPDAC